MIPAAAFDTPLRPPLLRPTAILIVLTSVLLLLLLLRWCGLLLLRPVLICADHPVLLHGRPQAKDGILC
jgi:hypothetical protein